MKSFNNTSIPTVQIMNVNVAAINMKWLLDFTVQNIKKLSGLYMCVSNVHTTVMSYENKDYCNIQNNAVLAIPDGGPLSALGRKRGFLDMSRTTGPDYMEEIFKISEKNNYLHFFFGSKQETLNSLEKKLREKYPNIKIVGMISPPFRELTEDEDNEIVDRINDNNPDFVWVGLGAPKQEKWMYNHKNKINGFMVGVGAGFDYFAGNIKRAPNWMQKYNLEWLYRLLQDPKRLFKRYFVTNIKFIVNAVIRGK